MREGYGSCLVFQILGVFAILLCTIRDYRCRWEVADDVIVTEAELRSLSKTDHEAARIE